MELISEAVPGLQRPPPSRLLAEFPLTVQLIIETSPEFQRPPP